VLLVLLVVLVPLVIFFPELVFVQIGAAGEQLPGKGSGVSGVSGNAVNTSATHAS
jgi:hypothetical protein